MVIVFVIKEFRRMVQCICLDCCSDCWTKGSMYFHGLNLVWMIGNCLKFASSVFQRRFLFNRCLNVDWSRRMGYILLKPSFASCSAISHLYFLAYIFPWMVERCLPDVMPTSRPFCFESCLICWSSKLSLSVGS